MPYQGGNRLSRGEQASKLGHLEVVNSPFVKRLIDQFESPLSLEDLPVAAPQWQEFDGTGIAPLSTVLAVDGSVQVVRSDEFPSRSLAFIKTALVRLDSRKLAKIDKEMPHPVLMKELMSESALQHSTVLPLRSKPLADVSNYDLVRLVIRDSLLIQDSGLAHQALKWLAYRKWDPRSVSPSPDFSCPHCSQETPGLPYDADQGICGHCGNEVFLSDMVGFHLEMGEDQAPESVASAYMLINETLLLFSVVSHYWNKQDFNSLSNVLLIKDGPLALRAQYSKLVPNIRDFFQFARERGCNVHLIGQEKTGRFVDHLAELQRYARPKVSADLPRYAVLSHAYIRKQVEAAPDRLNPYGLKTNYGEKVFVKLDPYTWIVLSVPTGSYDEASDFPRVDSDLIGLERILATLPTLVSYQNENALTPIALAHGVASLSSYPSAAVLKLFAKL